MKKQLINPHWLHVLLDPLAGLADDDVAVAKYRSLDPNNEQAMRDVIRQVIVPYLARIDVDSQGRIKDAYRFYLSRDESRWDRVFDSTLLPFGHPILVRHFFCWIWEECFPNQDWRVEDLTAFKVREDTEEPLRLLNLAEEGKVKRK